MVRVKHNDFIEKINKNFGKEYTVLDEYQGSRNKIRVRHNVCGGVKLVEPRILLNSRNGCNECSKLRRMKKVTKTTEQFKKELEDITGDEYTLEGEYKTSRDKVQLRHKVCGGVYVVRPNGFLSHGARCSCRRGKGDTNVTYKPSHAGKRLKELLDKGDEEYVLEGDIKGNYTKVNLRHKKCGNIYKVDPYSFVVGGKRCGYCNGNEERRRNAAEQFEIRLEELRGKDYKLESKYINSKTKVKVRHISDECDNSVFEVLPNNILKLSRCPKCYGTPKKTTEEFKEEVERLVGDEYLVLGEYVTNKDKITMKHTVCGESYEAVAGLFLRGRRCPNCKESYGESKVREFLIKNSVRFKKEVRIDYDNGELGYVDFVILGGEDEIIGGIEFDGVHHFKPVNYYKEKKEESELRYKRVRYKDSQKNDYFKDKGIPLLRIPYWEIKEVENKVGEFIKHLNK